MALENPDDLQLASAWFLISHIKDENQQRYEITAEEYEEVKQHYRELLKNNYPEERRKKISENNARRGKPGTFLGHTYSDESKEKMRAKHLGKQLSKDHREKIRQSELGITHSIAVCRKHGIPVICIETNDFYYSAKEAAEAIDKEHVVSTAVGIRNCCKKARGNKSAKGYHWRFATQEEISNHKKIDEYD